MKRPALLLLLLAPLGACSSDFDPPSLLDDLRVLALIADPLELGPSDSVTVAPVLHLPPGRTVERSFWSFCPFSAGAVAGYACAAPGCEVPLAEKADGSIEARPGELALACAKDLASSGDAASAVPETLPERFAVLFRYRAISSSGVEREAVLQVSLWTAGPPRDNRHPAISEVLFGGVPASAGQTAPVAVDGELEVRARVDPASLDSYADESGRERIEEPIFYFYATAGRFEDYLAAGSDAASTWRAEELEEGQQEARIYVVARDLRGGQAVFGPATIPIERGGAP